MDNMLRLEAHPDSAVHNVDDVHVGFSLDHKGKLWLRYHVDCVLDELVLPDPDTAGARADNLWKATCFEAFIRIADAPGYVELNFSPSGQWAAYAFSSYREGMENQVLGAAPDIGLDASDSHFALEAELKLPDGLIGQPVDLALTAILHEKGGTHSYWSLVHPPGKPDFHHDACFSLKLAPPIIYD